jgi:hypothetical protein
MGEAGWRKAHLRALPLRSTVKCSDRISAEIIFDRDGMRVLWTPPPPFPFKATDEEAAAYRLARNDLMQKYARSVGRSVLMVEPDGKEASVDAITANGVHHVGKGVL